MCLALVIIELWRKRTKKVERHADLAIEIKTLWKIKSLKIIPVVIGTISNNLDQHFKQNRTTITMEMIQKSVLLGTARILSGVLGI